MKPFHCVAVLSVIAAVALFVAGFSGAAGFALMFGTVVEIIGAMQSFGEAVLFLDQPDPVLVEGLADSLVLHIASQAVFGQIEQDPRFGLLVLGEIASRALSPGINDSGTAIDVIGRQLRVLLDWAEPDGEEAAVDTACPRLYARRLEDEDLFDDAFGMIMRDGAGRIEVQVRLQKALAALGRYRVMAWVTGVMLLVLTAEMLLKYVVRVGDDVLAHTDHPTAFFQFAPVVSPATGPRAKFRRTGGAVRCG